MTHVTNSITGGTAHGAIIQAGDLTEPLTLITGGTTTKGPAEQQGAVVLEPSEAQELVGLLARLQRVDPTSEALASAWMDTLRSRAETAV